MIRTKLPTIEDTWLRLILARTITRAVTMSLGIAAFMSTASAQIYLETTDTGQTLATALNVGSGVTEIAGEIDNFDVDLFKLNLPSTTNFSAKVIFYTASDPDSMLVLFDSIGAIVGGSDNIDRSGGNFLSAFTVTDLAAGTYYLAMGYTYQHFYDEEGNRGTAGYIDSYGADPDDWEPAITVPPDGWNTLDYFLMDVVGTGEGNGLYTIELNTATVPEPAVSRLLLLGLGAFLFRRRSAS